MSCNHEVTGTSMCHCAACHQFFTSVSAFDLHQRLQVSDGRGTVICLQAAYARNKSGGLIFKSVRTTARGYTVWGSNRPDLPGRTRGDESQPLSGSPEGDDTQERAA